LDVDPDYFEKSADQTLGAADGRDAVGTDDAIIEPLTDMASWRPFDRPEVRARPDADPDRLREASEHAGRDEPESPSDRYDLAGEAKEDWKDGADPALGEITIDLERISDGPTRKDCIRLVVRIRRKGAAVIAQGADPQQAVLLSILNDLLMLLDRVEAAPAADEAEKQLLDEIGNKIKKRAPCVRGASAG
jgi:hypothetical protein